MSQMTKKTDLELRQLAVETALKNKPSYFYGQTSTGQVGLHYGLHYDLVVEAKKIFTYLKTGK